MEGHSEESPHTSVRLLLKDIENPLRYLGEVVFENYSYNMRVCLGFFLFVF